jgi:hypothetical protein
MRNPVAAAVVAVALCLLFTGLAMAQTVPGSLTLRWTLPTTGCLQGANPPICGIPLTDDNALQAVHVWIDTAPIPDQPEGAPTLTLTAGATTTTHTMQVDNGQTLYARISVRNASGNSGLSNQISELIALNVVPGVPTDLTIELVIGAQ